MPLSFETRSREELDLADRVAERALAKDREVNEKPRSKADWLMDILAANNACPLDLERLAEADEFEFVHDAFGIARHLNRKTGELEHCFLPRFARNQGGRA